MRIVMFYHSLRSDWNHGNAHFLRGVARELQGRGHQVMVCEPSDSWSASNLVAERGPAALEAYRSAYPTLASTVYDPAALDLDVLIGDADLVIVHEWNPHDLVRRVGEYRLATGGFVLLFHDTHHRAVTDAASVGAYDLRHYDGVLAYGRAIRDLYLARGWAERAWEWHEAADTRVFRPRAGAEREGDLVWIGNWGDGERSAELREFLVNPVSRLALRARAYGVRYPADALRALESAGIAYEGWLPNYRVPEIYSRHAVTVHVPRRPYVDALPGIPTIRVFEALACGIPLVSAPWDDVEGLFTPGEDFLVARDGAEMERLLRELLADRARARALARHGLATIRARHSCAHRAGELEAIIAPLLHRRLPREPVA